MARGVCKFYKEGRCSYGDRCKFDHPDQQSRNSFAALSGNNGGRNSGGKPGNQKGEKHLTFAEEIGKDLSIPYKNDKYASRPDWIYSCYGPRQDGHRQLFGGPQRELSFEEMRMHFYEVAARNESVEPLVQHYQALYAEITNQFENIKKDLSGAVKYLLDGADEHPNRLDFATGTMGTPWSAGQTAQYGQPAAFGQPQFGQPQFGQPQFGQPTFSGGPNNPPAFGQPSPFPQNQPTGTGFGKPSAFGQPSAPAKPSDFSQFATGPSAFSQHQQEPQPVWGQFQGSGPNQGTGGGFGQAAPTTSPFSQIQQQQQQPQQVAFGQPSNPPNPFGAPSQQAGPSQPSNPFGAPSQQAAPPQPTSAPTAAAGTGPPPFIKPVDGLDDLQPIPFLSGPTTRDPMTKKLRLWKGRPVQYIENEPCYIHPQDGQTLVRILFPDGPPDDASLKYAESSPDDYTPDVTAQYEFFMTHGYFKDDVVPKASPKKAWMSFDF